MKSWLKPLCEIGPIVVFFVANSRWGIFAGTAVFVVATMVGSLTPLNDPAGTPAGFAGAAAGTRPTEVRVEPGHTEIERGTPLLVVARFDGPVPPGVTLVVEGPDGASEQAMSRSLEDPTFAGQVPSVQADLSYHVAFNDQRSETFRVKVFEYPEVKRVDARLVFPAFAQAEPKTMEDVRYVTAVEGTELTLSLRLNKEVAEVRSAIELTDDQKQRLAAALSNRLGLEVEVKVIVDPAVLGGVIAQVGDTVIDGSVRTRLTQLREQF